MNFLFPDWKDAPDNIGALSTMRADGVSQAPFDDGVGGGGLNFGTHVNDRLDDVMQNRALLRSILPSEPVWLAQVHGTNVVDVAGVDGVPQADAGIATQAGQVCVVQTADCLPVLFCDVKGTVVAAAHAGWRGLVNGVLEQTVMQMRDAGAGEILAWFGPAIGPEQFEVGTDVFDAFVAHDSGASAAFKPIAANKYLADIYILARRRLGSVGVERSHGGGFCTVSDRRFYSYRRDRITGRMASLIWLK